MVILIKEQDPDIKVTMAFRDEIGTTYEAEHIPTRIRERFTVTHTVNPKKIAELHKLLMTEAVDSIKRRVRRLERGTTA